MDDLKALWAAFCAAAWWKAVLVAVAVGVLTVLVVHDQMTCDQAYQCMGNVPR